MGVKACTVELLGRALTRTGCLAFPYLILFRSYSSPTLLVTILLPPISGLSKTRDTILGFRKTK